MVILVIYFYIYTRVNKNNCKISHQQVTIEIKQQIVQNY